MLWINLCTQTQKNCFILTNYIMKIHTSEWLAPMSEQEMIDKFWVDIKRREPRTLKHNTWATTVKRSDWEIAQVPNYQTTINFDRKYPEFFESMEDYIKKFIETKPLDWDSPTSNHYSSWILATTIRADAHIDKKTKVSTNVLKKKLIESDKRLQEKMNMFGIEKQLLVVLGDYMNSDGSYRTTKGTEQQNSMNEYEAFSFGSDILKEVIYNRWKYTDVDTILVQGNHDEHKLLYVRDLLACFFQNNWAIKVQDAQNSWRYYYKRGDNLIGFTHWHLIKPQDLPMVMNKENWNAKHKERYTGHRHKLITQSFHWMNVNTIGATTSQWEWNDKFWVDHINNQLFWVLHHKKDWKIAQFWEKI